MTAKTRVLYLNSPSNPTGAVLTRAYLERLAAIAHKHNLWVISDEAYVPGVDFGRTAKATCASASRATAKSSQGPSTR